MKCVFFPCILRFLECYGVVLYNAQPGVCVGVCVCVCEEGRRRECGVVAILAWGYTTDIMVRKLVKIIFEREVIFLSLHVFFPLPK